MIPAGYKSGCNGRFSGWEFFSKGLSVVMWAFLKKHKKLLSIGKFSDFSQLVCGFINKSRRRTGYKVMSELGSAQRLSVIMEMGDEVPICSSPRTAFPFVETVLPCGDKTSVVPVHFSPQAFGCTLKHILEFCVCLFSFPFWLGSLHPYNL